MTIAPVGKVIMEEPTGEGRKYWQGMEVSLPSPVQGGSFVVK